MAKRKQNTFKPGDEEASVLQEMYKEYFLDYASYVILERAVPAINDGLKPVQRRILHSMREMDDGRFHKVANIIGQTMQYHPHGDAAIGDALVNMGQKDLLIETQGNWGDVRTGDSAAAPRYIEARLSKFAMEVAFNPDLTEWQLSYDGRKNEPVTLPLKFPLVLSQGVEGIAVGLSTRILPHNFCELIDASIKVLKGKSFKIYPDFMTGGMIDVQDYQKGKRGGRVKVRARIEKVDNKTLAVRDLPYGVTTDQLIDSILKANDKNKIKIKRVVDNTAKDVEILIELASGISPDLTIDALFAFTHCEVSISPNACVIVDEKPKFMTINDILIHSTHQTKDLLGKELELKEQELENKWHFASLEKIFIGERIYRDMEECKSWEEVLAKVEIGLLQYVSTPEHPKPTTELKLKLKRPITAEDITRLTEIKIKKISRYNIFKANELIESLEEELAQVRYDLEHLNDFTIKYYENLLQKYGPGRERKTEIRSFDEIEARDVVVNNAKLYVNRKEGFIGTGLKKDEFVTECSDLDDIIVIRRDGVMQVTRITDKTFVGKNILHVDVWKKGDERTTYHLIYLDGKSGRSYIKRFQVKAITRDREYPLISEAKGSKVLYLSVHPNGEAEIIKVNLSPNSRARNKEFTFDFSDLDIRSRNSKGNILTKYNIQKITQLEIGKSTLGSRKYWIDEVSGKINCEQRGMKIGAFDTGETMLAIDKGGNYEMIEPEEGMRLEIDKLLWIGKWSEEKVVSAVYYDGMKKWSVVKRFKIETQSLNTKFLFITEHPDSELIFVSTEENPKFRYSYRKGRERIVDNVNLGEFIDVKGWKALGNKLIDKKVKPLAEKKSQSPSMKENQNKKFKPGDSVDFDLNGNGQTKMF